MAKYKPGKSGVASRKIKKLKEDIKSESDKDRIKKLEEQLAILMASRAQDTQGGKSVSDADVERMKRLYDAPLYDAPMPRAFKEKSRDDLRSLYERNGYRNFKSATPTRKKGGGKIYASMNKKYGGGIYPRKVKM